MKTSCCLVVLTLAWIGAQSGAAAATKFELAGVDVTLAEDWEVTDVKASGGQVGKGGIDGVVPAEGKAMFLRARDGQVIAAMFLRGSRGQARQLRFNDTACPEWERAGAATYARRLIDSAASPPQCLFVQGVVDGQQMAASWFGLDESQAKAMKPLASAWHVVAFAYNSSAAQFTTQILVSADGFTGLPAARPVGAPQGEMPPAVAAWGDAVGASMKKALEGVFSRSTQLPPLVFDRSR